jgi:gliding motility-associated protein GldE
MSGSELAFFSLTPHELDKLSRKKHHFVFELRDNPEKLLATILISSNFLNVAVIITATYCYKQIFDITAYPAWVNFIFETVLITFLLLLFSEVAPKLFATQYRQKMVIKSAPILYSIQKILSPFSAILVKSSSFIHKRLAKYNRSNISVDELSNALKITTKDDDEDKEILEGIVNFGSISVNQVMTSRLDMIDIDLKISYRQVLDLIVESGYSRMPVYQGSEDNIRGILYTKDLLPHLDKTDSFRWQSLIRPAYFVPETRKIDDLLADFQKNKIHIAIVVDEFGGTLGLVTMEDILEEIVGDINDEYDEHEPQYQQLDKNTYLIEAKILLNDFFRIEGINENDFEEINHDVDSLAGLVLKINGDIPHQNETIDYKKYSFEIINADDRRIETIKLKISI